MDEDIPEESGLLSPRRIEANHIAFNRTFDNARSQGILRHESTYRPFDQIFNIAMRRRSGLPVEELEVGGMEVESTTLPESMDLEVGMVEDVGQGEGEGVKLTPHSTVQVVINSQGTERDILFSDEEETIVKPDPHILKRKQGRPRKRIIEEVDGIPLILKTKL